MPFTFTGPSSFSGISSDWNWGGTSSSDCCCCWYSALVFWESFVVVVVPSGFIVASPVVSLILIGDCLFCLTA